MTYIDETTLTNKTILLRVDFNVSLNPQNQIANDARIRQSIPTIEHLIKGGNKLILISHLGQPEGGKVEPEFSLRPVADDLQKYLPQQKVTLINDFKAETEAFSKQTSHDILLLENIRFWKEEKANDLAFAKQLASLAEIFVNDAFGVCHRKDASVVSLPTFLPSYGGLLLKKEVTILSEIVKNPKKPLVAIIGGAKIVTKINLIETLLHLADTVIIGGGLANNFLIAQGNPIGKSIFEQDQIEKAKALIAQAKELNKELLIPIDAVVGTDTKTAQSSVKALPDVSSEDMILDIGPATQALYGNTLARAATIVWNGPVGFFENDAFRRGTDFIYYSIAENPTARSIVGGGDTLAAIEKKEYLEKITHISTGGGAMLDFIEHGTLPGVEALK